MGSQEDRYKNKLVRLRTAKVRKPILYSPVLVYCLSRLTALLYYTVLAVNLSLLLMVYLH